MIKEITVQELKALKDNGEDFQLIDVREPYEYEIASIGGELLPLGTILENHTRINTTKKVAVLCRSGKRSATAILKLQEEFGFDNLYNVKGGILQWANEVDNSITKY